MTMTSCAGQPTCQPTLSLVASRPDSSGNVGRVQTEIGEERAAGSHNCTAAEASLSGGDVASDSHNLTLDVPPRTGGGAEGLRSPPRAEPTAGASAVMGERLAASQQSQSGVEGRVEAGPTTLRTSLTPSFKSLCLRSGPRRHLSPVPELSPTTQRETNGDINEDIGSEGVWSLYRQSFARDCTNIINDIHRFPFRSPCLGRSPSAMDISSIEAEPPPLWTTLNCTMEASCLGVEMEPSGRSEFGPLRVPLGNVSEEVEEEAVRVADEGGPAEGCKASSRENPAPLHTEEERSPSSTGSHCSSGASLNGTYTLSHSQGSEGALGLMEARVADSTVGSRSAPSQNTKEGSSARADVDTCVFESHSAASKSSVTNDTEERSNGPSTEAGGMEAMMVRSKNHTFEVAADSMGDIVARPNVTTDISKGSFSESHTGDGEGVVSKGGNFKLQPHPPCEPTAGSNVTVDLTKSTALPAETGSSSKRAESQNGTFDLGSNPAAEPECGPNQTFQLPDQRSAHPGGETSKKTVRADGTFELQPGLAVDPVGVCEDEEGAQGRPGPLRKVESAECLFSNSMIAENSGGADVWSLDGTLDMKDNFLVTSTPLVVPKTFNFAHGAVSAASDVRKRLSIASTVSACPKEGAANTSRRALQDGPPRHAGLKLPTGSLPKPSALTLQPGASSRPSVTTGRKSLLPSSGLPNAKSLLPPPRPSTSRLSLAAPPKTLAAPQVPGAPILPSSALPGRKMAAAPRSMMSSGPAETSLSSASALRRHSLAETKLPTSSLQRPRASGLAQPSSSRPHLGARPLGAVTFTSQTQKAAASGLKGKVVQASATSQKQPRGNSDDSLPVSKRKKVDVPVPSANGEASGGPPGPAGSSQAIRRPPAQLRGPLPKPQSSGARQLSGTFAAETPVPASDVTRTCDGDPQLSNGSIGAQATDCENCARYQQEIERLRAELRERDKVNP